MKGPSSGSTLPAPVVDPGVSSGGRVVVRGLRVDGRELPGLVAEPGERILVRGASPTHAREVLAALAVPGRSRGGSVCVDGKDLAATGPKTRRRRVGHAAAGARLERGPISRAVRYRRPDLPAEQGTAALAAVGLADRVAALPEGERTPLRRGGEPLTRHERARLHLARAMLGEPALLLLEHVDDDLGTPGKALLRGLLEDYPGVVVVASDRPQEILAQWRDWTVPTPAATSRPPRSAPRASSPLPAP